MGSWAARKRRVLGAVTRTFSDGPFTYTPADGSAPYQVEHVPFEDPAVQVGFGGEAQVATVEPSVFVRLSDLAAAPAERDRITQISSGRSWEIREVQQDGHGGAHLLLFEVDESA